MDETKIPTRNEIPEADKWDLSYLFAGADKWSEDFAWVQATFPRLTNWKGRLGESAATLAEMLEFEKALDLKIERVYHYASLQLAEDSANPDYLALYAHADLFLDTWPYNAHTTASDALWAGCPVVTILGETFAGRVAASLLHAVGLPELVTASIDGYVERAVALAGDDAERARLRAHLAGAGRASPLFDTAATTRALERAYTTMVEQRRRGVREGFAVA